MAADAAGVAEAAQAADAEMAVWVPAQVTTTSREPNIKFRPNFVSQ